MGFITSQFDYVLGKNLATMEDKSLTGSSTYAIGSKIKDKGVYEITFSYSVRSADTTISSNPHFFIGFGVYVSSTSASWTNKTLVRLAFPNKNGDVNQSYPFQMEHTVWVTKTTDAIIDFMCNEQQTGTSVYFYNINAVAKKIADI